MARLASAVLLAAVVSVFADTAQAGGGTSVRFGFGGVRGNFNFGGGFGFGGNFGGTQVFVGGWGQPFVGGPGHFHYWHGGPYYGGWYGPWGGPFPPGGYVEFDRPIPARPIPLRPPAGGAPLEPPSAETSESAPPAIPPPLTRPFGPVPNRPVGRLGP